MTTDTHQPTLRFAVLGAGNIGPVHTKALLELPDVAELVAIADVVPERAEALAERAGEWGGHPRATSDIDALLRSDEIDAVCVCVPSGQHADLAIAALEAGKHVVVEKPIEVSLEAADRLIAAEEASGKTVAVISQHRFDRSTEKVLDAVRGGRLGRITSIIASHAWWRGQSYYDSGDWRGTWALDGGGATMNQTVHTINLLITMAGTPVEVFAYTACLAHERIEVEDTAVAVVKFDSGALGMIHATTAAYPGLDARLSVYGSKGSAVISNDGLVYFHETEGEAEEIAMSAGTAGNQVTEDDAIDPAEAGLGVAHRAQLADFVEAVHSGRAPRVTTRDARTTLAVILGMYESANTHQPVAITAS
ncbi:MAG TPA: Gfo/Idh/MocA family oxidoreductase [Propionibacteriaceae bacterium]|nr:Gfo/Idh/MocA family oxidoreductase [Propionibacteriaceae bacterium]